MPIDAMVKSKGNIDEKISLDSQRERSKFNKGIALIVVGSLGMICLPFLAEWEQAKNMEIFKTAYEHSYNYILEYPLSIILVSALALIGLGVYFIHTSEDRFDNAEG